MLNAHTCQSPPSNSHSSLPTLRTLPLSLTASMAACVTAMLLPGSLPTGASSWRLSTSCPSAASLASSLGGTGVTPSGSAKSPLETCGVHARAGRGSGAGHTLTCVCVCSVCVCACVCAGGWVCLWARLWVGGCVYGRVCGWVGEYVYAHALNLCVYVWLRVPMHGCKCVLHALLRVAAT